MTEKARWRVAKENPIRALKCYMQGAGVGTLKGEDSQCLPGLEVKDGDAEDDSVIQVQKSRKPAKYYITD